MLLRVLVDVDDEIAEIGVGCDRDAAKRPLEQPAGAVIALVEGPGIGVEQVGKVPAGRLVVVDLWRRALGRDLTGLLRPVRSGLARIPLDSRPILDAQQEVEVIAQQTVGIGIDQPADVQGVKEKAGADQVPDVTVAGLSVYLSPELPAGVS